MADRDASISGSASGPVASSSFVGKRPPGARDPAWKYAYLGPYPGSVFCIKCQNVYRGGINRLKYHLAGISRRDAKACTGTTEEIKRQMNAILAAAEERKLQREKAKAAMQASIASSQGAPVNLESDDDALQGIVGSLRGPRNRRQPTTTASPSSTSSRAPGSAPTRTVDSFFVPRNTPGSQTSLEATGWNKEVHEHAYIACADFWYFNNIPFNVANSPYWHNLVTALTVAGKGFKAPSRTELSGRLVNLMIIFYVLSF